MNFVTFNELIVKDTFCFEKETVEQDNFLVIGSLDVDSLFTKIPIDETIDICTNTVCCEQDLMQSLSKEEFRHFLSLVTKESYFIITRISPIHLRMKKKKKNKIPFLDVEIWNNCLPQTYF